MTQLALLSIENLDTDSWLRQWIHLPLTKFLTAAELESAFTDAGFEIDHNWRPGEGKAVFLIGKKPG